MREVKVLIAAGGSGGHIFPAISLGRALKSRRKDVELLFVGSDKALDKRIFEKEGAAFSLLSANKLPYTASLALVPFFMRLCLDTVKSFAIMLSYKPDVIVGFGGYISFPAILAGRMLRVPAIVHEQNVVPGRANRILFRLADRIALSFEDTRAWLGRDAPKAVMTGNPIRTEMFRDDRSWGIRKFGFDANKFTVLVIGGSQGSHALNRTFIDALFTLADTPRRSLQVIHITGARDYEWAASAYEETGIEYRVHSFVDRIEEAYSASDLVVTRSGASALFELAFLGKPMILVPYPFAMSHQKENAAAFSKNGAAFEIDEKDLSADRFRDTLVDFLNNRQKLKSLGAAARRMAVPGASEILAREVAELAGS